MHFFDTRFCSSGMECIHKRIYMWILYILIQSFCVILTNTHPGLPFPSE